MTDEEVNRLAWERYDEEEFKARPEVEDNEIEWFDETTPIINEREQKQAERTAETTAYYEDNNLESYFQAASQLIELGYDPKVWEELGYDTEQQFIRDSKMLLKLQTIGKNKAKIEMERRAYDQASLYRPLPNLQAALTEAYTDQLLNNIGIADLQRVVDNIPDIVPIGPIADSLRCPWNTLFTPSIKRFLGTSELYTAFDCAEGLPIRRPFLPKIDGVNIKDAFSTNIEEAFFKAVSDATVNALMGLLDLAINTLEEAVCRTIGGLGDNLINAINGGGEDGFFEVMAAAFGGNPDLPSNKRDLQNGLADKLLEGYGIVPDDCPELDQVEVSENYRSLYKAIGYSLNVREMKELFSFGIDEYNPLTLARITESIDVHAPCFRDTFNNNQKVGKFFRDISSSVPLDVKNNIRASITDADDQVPVFTSICLNQQQYDKWKEDRIGLLVSLGIPEDIARDNVDEQDKNNAESLEKLLGAQRDMGEFLQDNVANSLSVNDGPQFDDEGNLIDPSCYKKGGLLDTNSDDIASALDVVNSAYFDALELQFTKDLTTGGFFTDGLMNRILANTNDESFSSHNVKSTRTLDFGKRFLGYEDDPSDDIFDVTDIFYPKTVGLHYYTETQEPTGFSTSVRAQAEALEQVDPSLSDLPVAQLLDLNMPEGETRAVQPPSFSLEFEQQWDTNFESTSALEKRTSTTRLYLEPRDEAGNYSPFTYRITNTKTSVKNKNNKEIKSGETDPELDMTLQQELDPSLRNYINRHFGFSATPVTDELATVVGSPNAAARSQPIRALVFNKYIVDSFSSAGLDVKSKDNQFFYSSPYGKMSQLLYNETKNMCYNDLDGQMNSGFSFGYDPEDELTEDDYKYVDPEPGSTSYTKPRTAKILGRSQTDHPRVFFLDPEKHGGSYVKPKIYVAPPRTFGWLSLYDAIIPEVDGCEPSRQVIINTNEIKQYVSDTKNKIARDPRLNNASDCIKLIPFDLIINQQSRAQIEGAIKTILRVFSTESYIFSSPVFASIFSGFDGNYDDAMFHMIATEIIEDMETRSGALRGLISNKYYVNTFLEQCVQMYARMYYSGETEPSEEAMNALSKIEESQMRYKYPSDTWLKDFFDVDIDIFHQYPHKEPTLEDLPYETPYDIPADVVGRIYPLIDDSWYDPPLEEKQEAVQELLIRDFYVNSLMYVSEGEKMFVPPSLDLQEPGDRRMNPTPEGNIYSMKVQKPPGDLGAFVKKSNKYFRFYTRMYVVRTMREECISIFKELLKKEFRYIVNSMANAIDKKADVFRVSQHFSTRDGVFYGNNTDFGTFRSVLQSEVSGEIESVTNNINENFFNKIEISNDQADEIKAKGCFVIQKYFRVMDKTDGTPLPPRSDDLKGVVNPESFLEYINSPLPEDVEVVIDDNMLISDAFGDLEFIYGLRGQELIDGVVVVSATGEPAPPIPEDTPEESLIELGIKGSVGIKKGIRLMYVPNEEYYEQLMLDNPALSELQTTIADGTITSEEYLRENAFFSAPFTPIRDDADPSLSLAIPLASVEIEEFDQELKNLQNFNGNDYKCLLTKLVESDEYKMLFEYCFPINIYIGHNIIHTNKSFYMSLGQGDRERIEHNPLGLSRASLPKIPRSSQPDDEIRTYLDDTKDNLRRLFASIYTVDDYKKTFQFDGDLERQGLADFLSLFLPTFRFLGGHRKARRPFNKDGGECESPVGKIFGDK